MSRTPASLERRKAGILTAVVAAGVVAFLCKLAVDLRTYGTNDAMAEKQRGANTVF